MKVYFKLVKISSCYQYLILDIAQI